MKKETKKSLRREEHKPITYANFRNRMDELSHYKKKLIKVVEEAKPINTAYQKYLMANPHKEKKLELEAKREKYTKKIIEKVPGDEW